MIELTLRIIFSLLVVLGLMWGLARLVRRPLGARRGHLVDILGRHQLSRGASVAVVRVADRALVLGVTDGHVTLLTETDLETIEEYQETAVRREHLSLESLTGSPAGGGNHVAPVVSPERSLTGSMLLTRTWNSLRGRGARKS
ncbi:MAG: flagellar protein FliO/FliZ [Micromonosporaceae bacterium]|nr:flagellar protein FliO/FliZ [Micromonosporaceae bacterium]